MSTAPISPVPQEARSFQGHRAGVVTRTVAACVDAAVVGVVVLAGWVGVNGLKFVLNPRTFSFGSTSLLLSLTAAFVVLVTYLTAGWAFTGRTYGDHVMGLRVVSSSGRRLDPVRALLRALFCAFFPIGLYWCAASRSNRSVQDIVLRSSVIYDWKPTSWRLAGGAGGATTLETEPVEEVG
jgi:uncharacterized RDD family membrane protein YckC